MPPPHGPTEALSVAGAGPLPEVTSPPRDADRGVRTRGRRGGVVPPCPRANDTLATTALIRALIRVNLDSVQIAKELMLAQEVADLHCARIDTAIDAAAASGGDPVAIDEAVAAVAAAEQANVAELTLSKAWGTHLGEVYRLVEVAEELLGGLEARARAGANA